MNKISLSLAIACAFSVFSANASITFKDSRGKEIELDHKGKKIVAIASSAPIIYSAVSKNPNAIVSITKKTQKSLSTGLYSEFFPYFKTLKADAANDKFIPNVEAILKYNPDLIIQWSHDPKIVEPLERVGLKVATWPCCTNEDREATVLMSGKISGENKRAEMIIEHAKNENLTLKNELRFISDSKRVTMLEIDKIDQDVRIIAKNSLDYSIAKMNNVGYDKSSVWWETINLEQLYKMNPDFIIVPAWADDINPKDFYNNDLLKDLKAVKNKQVYKVPLFNRSPDASESYLTLQWISRLAYQGKQKTNFKDKVKETYKTIYNVDLTDEQFINIMQIDSNKESKNYMNTFDL